MRQFISHKTASYFTELLCISVCRRSTIEVLPLLNKSHPNIAMANCAFENGACNKLTNELRVQTKVRIYS